jgi:tripartite-type tricarboxylate transporter receptor subunit TctC
MQTTVSLRLLALILLAPCITPALAQQDYPNKPIRWVIMFAPGSASDVTARFAGSKLTEQLGVPFLVDAKPGAGGLIAIRDVHKAQPVGYSLLHTNSILVANTFAFKEPGYKLDDFTPVGVLGKSYYVVMANQKVAPVKSLQEFVTWAKANQGKVNYAGLGPATPPSLYAERFKMAAGIDMLGITYKGGDPAGLALLAGDVHVYWATQNTTRQRTKSPGIVPLAIVAEERTRMFPQVPTFKELGYPTLTDAIWSAVMVPSSIPAPMLKRLRDAYATASSRPDWIKQMDSMELDQYKGTPDEFMAMVRKESANMGELFKVLKIPQE